MTAKKRRAGVIHVSEQIFDELHRYRIRLPEGVLVADFRKEVDRDCVVVRLEGDGLPESYEVQEGLTYPHIDCEVKEVGLGRIPTLKLLCAVEAE